jgi:hypothetical protein
MLLKGLKGKVNENKKRRYNLCTHDVFLE